MLLGRYPNRLRLGENQNKICSVTGETRTYYRCQSPKPWTGHGVGQGEVPRGGRVTRGGGIEPKGGLRKTAAAGDDNLKAGYTAGPTPGHMGVWGERRAAASREKPAAV